MKNIMVLAMAFLMLSCAQQEEAQKYIGIQLWSVGDDMKADTEGTLQALGEMGYSFVEAAGYSNGQFYGMEPLAFKELVESNGMDFLGSHTGKDIPAEGSLEEVLAWWEQALDAHKAAGVEYVVQPWMGGIGHESLEGLKRYCDYFNQVGQMANERGLRFGFHNHAEEFKELEGEIIYDFMLENTDPEKVMFQMDIYWVVKGGKDPVDYINRFPGRFENWHVKDEQEVGASGDIDFERIFAYTGQAGMEYMVVEVESYNYEPLESVRISLNYLLEADYVK